MGRHIWCMLACCACCLSTTMVRAAVDPWGGAQVLPKSSQTRLRGEPQRVTERDAGSVLQIAWPAAVEKIDGNWLFLRDQGGYSAPPVCGWVRKEEMLRLSEDEPVARGGPVQHYTEKIQENPTPEELATLYWLRGIYWEYRQERDVAIRDYCSAIKLASGNGASFTESMAKSCLNACATYYSPSEQQRNRAALGRPASPPGVAFDGLPDACMRLGRLMAEKDAGKEGWEECLRSAESLFTLQGRGLPNPVPAQLYLDWGNAAWRRQQKASEGNQPSTNAATTIKAPLPEVIARYQKAADVSPSWTQPRYRLGYVTLAPSVQIAIVEGKSETEGKMTDSPQLDRESLKAAMAYFSEAIRCDPTSIDAQLGRAQAQWLLATAGQGKPKPSSAAGANAPGAGQAPAIETDGPPPLIPPTAPDTKPTIRLSKEEEDLLNQAAESANMACALGMYREPRSLVVLANILAAHAYQVAIVADPEGDKVGLQFAKDLYDQAADYAGDAAELFGIGEMKARAQFSSYRDELLKRKTNPTLKPPTMLPALRPSASSIPIPGFMPGEPFT
jgi:hypothetical protein